MRLFDRMFTRRHTLPSSTNLSNSVRRRLAPACRELTRAEEQIAAHLGLSTAPRLLLVDEEAAAILYPHDRLTMSSDPP